MFTLCLLKASGPDAGTWVAHVPSPVVPGPGAALEVGDRTFSVTATPPRYVWSDGMSGLALASVYVHVVETTGTEG